MNRRDEEIQAILRIMAVLTPMTPAARTRTLIYVISRAECLGVPEPVPEQPLDGSDMFAEVPDRRVPRIPAS